MFRKHYYIGYRGWHPASLNVNTLSCFFCSKAFSTDVLWKLLQRTQIHILDTEVGTVYKFKPSRRAVLLTVVEYAGELEILDPFEANHNEFYSLMLKWQKTQVAGNLLTQTNSPSDCQQSVGRSGFAWVRRRLRGLALLLLYWSVTLDKAPSVKFLIIFSICQACSPENVMVFDSRATSYHTFTTPLNSWRST